MNNNNRQSSEGGGGGAKEESETTTQEFYLGTTEQEQEYVSTNSSQQHLQQQQQQQLYQQQKQQQHQQQFSPSSTPIEMSWMAQDPIILRTPNNTTYPSPPPGSRLDVLSPSIAGFPGGGGNLSRTRSLSRPERRPSQSVTSPRGKNILEETPISPWDPWVVFYNMVTCCFPRVFMSKVLGMPELEKQRAWREKVALCCICAFLCGALGFLTFGLQKSICFQDTVFTLQEVQAFNSGNHAHNVVIYGIVYDMSGILQSHNNLSYFLKNPGQATAIGNIVGVDVSPFFRHNLSDVCQANLQSSISFQCSSPSVPGTVYCHDWDASVIGLLNEIYVGPVYYGWDDVATSQNFVVFDGKVLNLTAYMKTAAPIFGAAIDGVIRSNLNTDITKPLSTLTNGAELGQCLSDMFNVGRLEATTTGCWTSNIILYVSFVIVMGLVMVRFTFAVYFRWFISNQLGKIMKDSKARKIEPLRRTDLGAGKFPITMTDQQGNLMVKHNEGPLTPFRSSLPRRSASRKSKSTYGSEVHTIMLVTCYSEDEKSLRLTFDSLAATDYNEDFKLLLIIADGIIKGQGNAKSTPDLILDLLELDSNWQEPIPMSYLAVADGAKQHNMAKVYVAWYNHKGRSVPTILIVKCGLPNETQKPGNRGKRDSQMILMRFLERITFNHRLCPLEYEIFLKMNYLMGVPPDCFEIVLMVDADTKVAPDSLARMVACMVRDPSIMGLCGETRIANKNDSWVSRIQVFEYYLSHHMTKAFESMFGGVTCLPGCFCMYRIKGKKGDSWVPILCSPEIVTTYSQSIVDTLHKKNLLLLGEDRFLTTLMLRTFPRRKLIFVPRAFCKTTVPNTFPVLLSQRRRWINSTIHNLMELILVNELCGIMCFSMQFVIFLELVGTVTLPAAICFTLLLIIVSIVGTPQIVPLMLLAAILGLPAVLILLTTRRVIYIYWMFIYLMALPVWNFVLPVYAFWHFDDFSWGQTRKVDGPDHGHGSSDKSVIGADAIPLRKWEEWERERRANIVISYRRRSKKIQG